MALFFQITKKLKEAGTAAPTQQERDICTLLANSITDGTPYAWKMFYSGEATSLLSEESYETLKEAIKNAKDIFHIPPYLGGGGAGSAAALPSLKHHVLSLDAISAKESLANAKLPDT
ncbi:hypothetical protein BVRB_5g109310 [Beta vulgaris subsp. vulgaris]|nr:hypothetical protein BVRB_5g109310 [Beta vulgaris subsp. vulgaris]